MGAALTGVIGFFVVVACAATLHVQRRRRQRRKGRGGGARAAGGRLASTLFGVGFLGASLLAAAVVPLSTAYSVAEAAGKPADIDDSFRRRRSST